MAGRVNFWKTYGGSAANKSHAEKTPVIKYTYEWPEDYDDLHIELECFRDALPVEDGGLGRLGHYQEICKLLWPDHVVTEWANKLQERFCSKPKHPGQPLSVVVTGPASAGKSTEAAKFAVVWQMMAPLQSAVPVTSTSVLMSRRRIWGEIVKAWELAKENCIKRFGYSTPGHVIQSNGEIQAVKGDSKHSIAIIPGSQEFSSKGVKKLQGWHAEYVLIVADELQDMTDEVIQSCVNMQAGTKEFIFIGLGNGQSWFNTLGKAMMPKSGNPEDVNEEMEEWETQDGMCLHLDGLKSPNITEFNEATGLQGGKYPWLVSQAQIDKAISQFGEDSVQYWQMVRGFPPPNGAISAVISESLMLKFGALNDEQLMNDQEKYAGLDPAFVGDACVLKFADVGTYKDGSRKGIVFGEKIEIQPKASATEPLDFQIANQVIEACKARGVKPRNFSGDGTGIGRGVLAIIRQNWSNDIHVVEFGGAASDLPVSEQDGRTGKDAYCDRATELWFGFRTFVINGQVRGITPQMARGFGARTYDTFKGKAKMQAKLEVKKTLGRSPDEEDASVTIVDNLRYQGFFAGPHGFDQKWEDAVREASSLEAGYAETDELLIC